MKLYTKTNNLPTMTIDEILDYIKEDKTSNPATTSLKFKRDVYDYFSRSDSFKTMNCCEFGTHKGQTTHVLSYLFNHVFTINLSEDRFQEARKINSNRENISYIPMNLYGEKLDYNPIYKEIEVFFIDAGHDYEHVKMDIQRVANMKPEGKPVWIIFDDYGLIPAVKRAVLEACDAKQIEIVQFVGHDMGYDFKNGRVLKDHEGVICLMV